MRWIRWLHVAIGSLIASGCGASISGSKGYKQIDGQWAWVATNVNGTSTATIDADADTFEILTDIRYGKDKYRVFRRATVIRGAEPATFELLSTIDYAKDKAHVFLQEHQIPGADPSSFKVIRYPFGRDARRVYCGTVPMAVENIADFEIVSEITSTGATLDRDHFLREHGQEFAHLEVSPEHPAFTCNAWSRDGKHYYYGPARVDGADYESFRIVDRFSAFDKNRKYRRSFPVNE